MPIRVLVVDDEAPARKRLSELLAREPDMALAGECTNGPDAVQAIEELQPDLLLLDVQMPEMDGFEVLRALAPERVPATIFITAYDEYAVRAFDVHAVDYLLKPVDATRFARALERVRTRLRSPAEDHLLRLLEAAAERPGYLERLAIREVGRIELLPVGEVDWLEAADNYVRVHMGKNARYMRATLKELERRLDPARFARIHRSAIVAIDRIDHLEPAAHGDYAVALRDGTRLAASRNYEHVIRRILGGAT